jgi:hypothetical protein
MDAVDQFPVLSGDRTLRSIENVNTDAPAGPNVVNNDAIIKIATVNIQQAEFEQWTRCFDL